MARRSAQILWLVPCGTRAPFGAPHALILVRYRASRYLSACSNALERMLFADVLSASGLALARPVARLGAGRAFQPAPGGDS